MTAHDFRRAQLAHVNMLCSSSQLVAFTERMRIDTPATRLVREFGNYAIANRDKWAAEEAAAEIKGDDA